MVRLTLVKNVTFNIVKEKTTTDLMKALSNMYEKPLASNKVHLMRCLSNLKMSKGGWVANHINEFNIFITQLSSVEITFDDEVKTLILLSSLPESWSAITTEVSSSLDNAKLKLNDIRDLILSEDIRRNECGESLGSTLSLKSRGRSQYWSHNQARSRSKSKGKDKNHKDIVC